ncbi:hypothetical protein Tco_1132014 [Tanacetum coccineum]|uniref:Retrovirus-related Pol polyprotein from transposon TNT 1-94-like beta-barrel domain-containing protein n=1 Tax=Tanacetum coccineum TaxID=301880 RepID=A0ABQ5JDT2_9ASTR
MKELADQLQEIFRQAYTTRSCNHHGSSILFVKKKDGRYGLLHRLSGTKQTKTRASKSTRAFEKYWRLLKKESLYAKFSKCEFWIPKCTNSALPEESEDHNVYCDARSRVLGSCVDAKGKGSNLADFSPSMMKQVIFGLATKPDSMEHATYTHTKSRALSPVTYCPGHTLEILGDAFLRQRLASTMQPLTERAQRIFSSPRTPIIESYYATQEHKIHKQQITYEDFDQIGKLDLEELDIKWQMAMLSVRINILGHFARECTRKQLDSKARYSSFKLKELDKTEEPKALLSVDSMLNWSDHKVNMLENGASSSNGMIAYSRDAGWYNNCPFGCEHLYAELKKEFDNVKLEESKARGLNKWKDSSKNLDKLIHSSMSSRSNFGLGFGETFGSDEVFDPSAPSIFDTTQPEDDASNLFMTGIGIYQHLFLAASVPTGSRNRPTSVPAGRPFSAGWKNNAARPMTRPTSHYFQHFRRPGYYNHLNMDEGRWGTAENPHKNRDLGIVDSGCSRSMTGNKEKLDDFVKIVGGTVTFGGGDGKITGKGTIRTSKLNFENVYYVEELQNFNLFSVSQICDTKNKVLFTDKECLVLSKEFQLPENSQVVLRVPRRNNLYCFNLSDIQN